MLMTLKSKPIRMEMFPMQNEDVEKFTAILDKMKQTYIAKNHDYGNSFHNTMDEFGIVAPVIRLNDKVSRLKTLTRNNLRGIMVSDESIRDTLLDLANYAVMTLVELTDDNPCNND